MGYALDPATDKLERVTTVTGTISAGCGCRLRYDDTDPQHRLVRLAHADQVDCGDHGTQSVAGAAYTGPVELLIPDPDERREFEREMLLEKSGCYDYDVYADGDTDATSVC